MGMFPYLAMTAAEFRSAPSLPRHCGWMACHFSPYSVGLSNLPEGLPKGSLLILNDRTPIHGHDPQVIAQTLAKLADRFGCSGILLDFQQPRNAETADLAGHLLSFLPCPTAVSSLYADLGGILFLEPVPPDTPLQTYLSPWKDREIWLELAGSRCGLLLTEKGCTRISPAAVSKIDSFRDESLHCHYRISEHSENVEFQLFRTAKDCIALLEEAEALGVQNAVGLYQEWAGQFV